MTTPVPEHFCMRGVCHRFQEGALITHALESIDLDVLKGEFVSLVGPSGCGKSTLLKIACGLITPSQGTLSLKGRPYHPLGEIGYMPQNDTLMPWRTVLQNVIVGLEVSGMPPAEALDKAKEHVPTFGLSGFENLYPAQLSGGMRQRAALLRTFLTERSHYVLDEPFGSLDSLTRMTMNRWLTEIWMRSEASILFTTHDLDEALYLSDRIYVLSQRPGRILTELKIDRARPRDHIKMARDPVIAEQKAKLLELLTPQKAEGAAT